MINPNDFRPKKIGSRRISTPEYRSWQMMKNRCLNPKGQDYHLYGGRGVVVDPSWMEFDNFIQDMGPRPSPLFTLEREDSDGPYNKDNCRWASRKDQSRNRSYCRVDELKAAEIRLKLAYGVRQIDLAKEYGVSQPHISQIKRRKVWT